MDFVHDQLFDGHRIRALTVVDTFTRLSPAIEVRQSFCGIDVVATLERVTHELGCPETIRLDNGPEFISKELDLWAFVHGVTLDFSRPGKPTDNAFIESFNGKFRAECLNANWFMSLDEAIEKCEAWRRDYNEVQRIARSATKCLRRFIGQPATPASRLSDEAGIFWRRVVVQGWGQAHNRRGSNRRWMKVQWQVIGFAMHRGERGGSSHNHIRFFPFNILSERVYPRFQLITFMRTPICVCYEN